MSKIFAYLNEQDGASAAEFALLIALAGVAVAATANLLGAPAAAANLVGAPAASAINDVATCIRTHSNAATC
ncbi:MAG TPA: hypothetical protein VGM25_08800 [Caulobacteraceae bacterium]|jgi:Flp pilus assembly pilin Flp